jgi:hypothetical protein
MSASIISLFKGRGWAAGRRHVLWVTACGLLLAAPAAPAHANTVVNLGNVAIGSSASKPIQTNFSGQLVVTIANFTLSAPDGQWQIEQNGCTGTFNGTPPTCQFTVRFTPTQAGPSGALVTFDANGVPGNVVSLTANGVSQPPTIKCLAVPLVVSADPGQCSGVIDPFTAVEVTPGSVGPVSVTFDNGPRFPVGFTTVTATATDADGLSSTCKFVVQVVDREAPVITCPPSVAVNNDIGFFGAHVTASATASDNCPGVAVIGARSDGLPLTDRFPVGTTTVNWTAIDVGGNQSHCSQPITVNEVEQPVTANLFVSAIGGAAVHSDQVTIHLNQSVTLTYQVGFYSGVVGDVSLQPSTTYFTSPTRGQFTPQKNIWQPSAADVNKTITLYARYANAKGASIQDTVSVHVIP